MQNFKKIKLSGFGNYPVIESDVYRPEKVREVELDIKLCTKGIIARGVGKSYGDAAIGALSTIDCSRLDRFLEFDAAKGIVKVEAGVLLSDILSVVVPKGWILPVIPGTKYVTAGGCFASNVHGKNQYEMGDFAEHVLEIGLRTENGKLISCSAQNNSEVFFATAGAMGLTGVIEHLTIKLFPITTASLNAENYRVDNLTGMIRFFREKKSNSNYMVGWIDHFAKGKNFGRGFFQAANYVKEYDVGMPLDEYELKMPSISVPCFMPSFLLNRYLLKLYNFLKFKSYNKLGNAKTICFESFFHPLDSIANWNKLYGRKGFIQYQFIIPDTKTVAKDIAVILKFAQKLKIFSFLAVIKLHRKGKGSLPFSIDGYSVALDIAYRPSVIDKLNKLTELVIKKQGKVYLAKDAVLNRNEFQRIYQADLKKLRTEVQKFQSGSVFDSKMNQRLQILVKNIKEQKHAS